jgi:flagellar protein FliO/FliZ
MKILLAAYTALAPASAATAPVQSVTEGGALFSLLVPLACVTFGLLALLWWLRRGNAARGGSGPVRLVQAIAVGARERVVVIDVEQRRLVIGVTATGISLLTELNNDPGEAPMKAR